MISNEMEVNMPKPKIRSLIVFALFTVVLNIGLSAWDQSLKASKVTYLANTPVDRVAFDKQGQVWVSGDGKLSVYKDGVPVQVFTNKDTPALGDKLSELEVDNQGRVWIAPQGNKRTVDLAVFDGTRWSTLLPTPGPARFTVLEHRLESQGGILGVHALAIDSQGRAWIGTETQVFYTIDGSNWEHLPIASKYVTCIAFDHQGRAWIGGDGLYIFDGKVWQIFTPENSPLLYGGVHAITFDQQGRGWIASGQAHGVGHGGGVSVFDGGNWISYPDISSVGFEDIAVDGAGRAWAIQPFGKGVLVFDGKSWKNHNFPVSDVMSNLATDEAGNIWIPTQKNGATLIPSDPPNLINLAIASHGLIYLDIFLIGIWLYFAMNAWRSTGLGFADLPTYFTRIKERVVKQSVPPIIKVSNLTIGYFGWFLIGNLVLFLEFSYFSSSEWNIFGVPLVTVIVTGILFFIKRNWLAYGILAAVITNTLVMTLIVFGPGTVRIGDGNQLIPLLKLSLSYPLPLGIFRFMQ